MDGRSCGVSTVRSRTWHSALRVLETSAARGVHAPACLICRTFGAFSGVGSTGISPRSSVIVGFSRMCGSSCSGISSVRQISDFSVWKSSHADVFSARDFFACRTYARRPCSCAVVAGALCDFCCSGRVRTSSVRKRGVSAACRGAFSGVGTTGAGRSCCDFGVIGGVAAAFAACCMYARRPCSWGVGVGVLCDGIVSGLARISSVRCRGVSSA